MFGQPNDNNASNNTTTTGFGAPTPAPTSGLFGGFASTSAPTSGLFGGSPPPPTGGAFGPPAPSPYGPSSGGFGGVSSTSVFGNAPAPATSGGLFGGPTRRRSMQERFGQRISGFGAAPSSSGGLFGVDTGLFGSTPAPTHPSYGPAVSSSGGFFASSTSAPVSYSDPVSGSLFGTHEGGFGREVPLPTSSRGYGTTTTTTVRPATHEHDATLWKTKKHADVTLVVQGQEIEAHKFALSRSTTLEPHLNSTDNRLEIADISPEAFEKVLQFLYTGSVDELGINDVNLIKHANTYGLPHLKDHVLAVMKGLVLQAVQNQIPAENITTILGAALENNADDLRDFALDCIVHNWWITKQAVKNCTNERARNAILNHLAN